MYTNFGSDLKVHSERALCRGKPELKDFSDPLPLSMLLLVTLNVISKSITTLITGEGGKCVLTMRMSEMIGNIASVSAILHGKMSH